MTTTTQTSPAPVRSAAESYDARVREAKYLTDRLNALCNRANRDGFTDLGNAALLSAVTMSRAILEAADRPEA